MNKEKIYDILMKDDIIKSINENMNYILNVIPEIKPMIGFDHKHPHHHLDVWNHTLLALSYSPKDFEVRLVLLLHDIGKPHSFQEGEIRHFKGHPKISSTISFSILKRLNFEEKEINKLCYLIENHDNPISNKQITENNELIKTQFIIQYCDALAHNPMKLEKRIKYLSKISEKINNETEQNKYKKLIFKQSPY